ncbi:MAG: RNA 3'-terminal phosphate cyclase [Candidatus Thermoplasmatota archaeon]|nr:RNA 3'-terminal phosphate cyclase [Candidatus Thermoplasmatota archaeon]
MLEIDGSHGEGGGQIFRMALAFSALRREEVRITYIRARRPNPGLTSQHIAAARLVASMCSGDVEGLELGSPEVTFRPGPLEGGSFQIDVGTAGSATLVLQTCLLPAIFAAGPTELRIRGGTDVKWSPTADYFVHVFLRQLGRMGIHAKMRILKRGYYPKGGGLVEARIEPASVIAPLRLPSPSKTYRLGGRAHVSNLPQHIAQRMRRAALRVLADCGEMDMEEVSYGEAEALGPGGAIVLWAESRNTILGSSALAEKGVRAEDVGRRAAEELLADLRAEATLDGHAADQLLPYLSLASGPSAFRVRKVPGHLKTLFWLLSRFLDVEFQTEEEEGGTRVHVTPSRTWRSTGTPPAAGHRGPDG